MSDDAGTPDERPKPPPPPPKHLASTAPPPRTPPPPPPPTVAAPEDPVVEESSPPVPVPDEPTAKEAEPDNAGPEKPAREEPAKPKADKAEARRASWLNAVLWVVLLALIALGIYAYVHHRNAQDQPPPVKRTQVVLPPQLQGATRVAGDTKALKALNTELRKKRKDASAVEATYVRHVHGKRQVAFVVTGINGDPGGALDYGKTSVKALIKRYLPGVRADDLHVVKGTTVTTGCGTVVRSGSVVHACLWVAPERAAMVTYPKGGSTARLAKRTRSIRAAVEREVTRP